MNEVIDRDHPRDPKPPLTLAEYLQELDVTGWPRHLKLILLALAVLLLLMGLNWARTFYTDWLWFSNLGYQQVLLKIVTTKVWLFLTGGLVFAAIAGTNLHFVFRSTRGQALLAQSTISPHLYGTVRQLLTWLSVGGVALISFFVAATAARQWDSMLRFLSAVPFGQADPIFQKDLGFFRLHTSSSSLHPTVVAGRLDAGNSDGGGPLLPAFPIARGSPDVFESGPDPPGRPGNHHVSCGGGRTLAGALRSPVFHFGSCHRCRLYGGPRGTAAPCSDGHSGDSKCHPPERREFCLQPQSGLLGDRSVVWAEHPGWIRRAVLGPTVVCGAK